MRGLYAVLGAALCLWSCQKAPAPAAPLEDAAELAPAPDLGPVLVARGTEPFWRLEILPGDRLYFTETSRIMPIEAPFEAPQRDGVGVLRIASGPISAVLTPEPCSDGMSDITYAYSAKLTVENVPFKGCAFARWDHEIADMLPAIDACLAAAGENLAVAYAALQKDNAPLVVLVRTNSERVACRPDASGAPLLASYPDAPLPGDGDVTFVRGPGEAPLTRCGPAPAVRDGAGSVIGWVLGDERC